MKRPLANSCAAENLTLPKLTEIPTVPLSKAVKVVLGERMKESEE